LSAARPGSIAQRKSLLSSRAELERIQLALALHDVKTIVVPRRPPEARRTGRATAIATALIAVGVPMLGRHRLARFLKSGSLLVAAWRIVNSLRRGAG
jgi:hypothetical protein